MEFIINNQKWKIKEVKEHNDNLLIDGAWRQGSTHFDKQTIYLLESLLSDRKEEVLLHELTHAFLYATQVNYYKDFDEENLCEFVALYSKSVVNIAKAYFETK